MKTYTVNKPLVLALAVTTLLAACHSGHKNSATPPVVPPTPAVTAEVPASASSSIGGFIDYLKALVVAMADTLEPVDVSKVTPPTDDTAEPTNVN